MVERTPVSEDAGVATVDKVVVRPGEATDVGDVRVKRD